MIQSLKAQIHSQVQLTDLMIQSLTAKIRS